MAAAAAAAIETAIEAETALDAAAAAAGGMSHRLILASVDAIPGTFAIAFHPIVATELNAVAAAFDTMFDVWAIATVIDVLNSQRKTMNHHHHRRRRSHSDYSYSSTV